MSAGESRSVQDARKRLRDNYWLEKVKERLKQEARAARAKGEPPALGQREAALYAMVASVTKPQNIICEPIRMQDLADWTRYDAETIRRGFLTLVERAELAKIEGGQGRSYARFQLVAFNPLFRRTPGVVEGLAQPPRVVGSPPTSLVTREVASLAGRDVDGQPTSRRGKFAAGDYVPDLLGGEVPPPDREGIDEFLDHFHREHYRLLRYAYAEPNAALAREKVRTAFEEGRSIERLKAMATLFFSIEDDGKPGSSPNFIATAETRSVHVFNSRRGYLEREVMRLGLDKPAEETVTPEEKRGIVWAGIMAHIRAEAADPTIVDICECCRVLSDDGAHVWIWVPTLAEREALKPHEPLLAAAAAAVLGAPRGVEFYVARDREAVG